MLPLLVLMMVVVLLPAAEQEEMGRKPGEKEIHHLYSVQKN